MPTTKNLDNLVINKVANEDVFRSMLAQGLVGEDDISFVADAGDIKQQIIISSTAPTTAQKFDDMLWYQILT